jgi:hypothetical protein
LEHGRRFSETQLPVDATNARAEVDCVFKITGAALTACLLAVIALTLSGCGGTDRRQAVNPAQTTAPRFVELRRNTSAGTVHFPRGLYTLETEDRNGYYYRTPTKVYQHSFGGSYPHDGGIFVSKRNQRKLRGYIMMAGGITHVGNLSGADYEFRY